MLQMSARVLESLTPERKASQNEGYKKINPQVTPMNYNVRPKNLEDEVTNISRWKVCRKIAAFAAMPSDQFLQITLHSSSVFFLVPLVEQGKNRRRRMKDDL